MFKVRKYLKEYEVIWNEFVRNSKNKHFFFYRGFMEYHADRFEDHSLMIWDESDALVAILPANVHENTLISHQGLTFGGLIVKSSLKQNIMLSVFSAVVEYSKMNEFCRIVYKRIPYIYHSMPADEDLYALFIYNFRLVRRDVSSAINLNNQISYSKGRKWLVNKAKKLDLEFVDDIDAGIFWKELESVLNEKHGVAPVHSVEEISRLKILFPECIKLYAIKFEGHYLAGCVLFISDRTVHTQYLFNTDSGRDVGALDLLIDRLVKDIYAGFNYFDFGISNEQKGRYLNEGLIAQKEGFGARAVCHEFYELDI